MREEQNKGKSQQHNLFYYKTKMHRKFHRNNNALTIILYVLYLYYIYCTILYFLYFWHIFKKLYVYI